MLATNMKWMVILKMHLHVPAGKIQQKDKKNKLFKDVLMLVIVIKRLCMKVNLLKLCVMVDMLKLLQVFPFMKMDSNHNLQVLP